MTAMDPELKARLSGGPRAVDQDKLDRVREMIRQARELEREKEDLNARLTEVNLRLNDMYYRSLPDVFSEAGVTEIGLPAEGNQPAYRAECKPYYKANIGADWTSERRAQAFQTLQELGHGDVIKNQFTVQFGRGEDERARAFAETLRSLKLSYDQKLDVPWTTLTALVKEEYSKGRSLSTGDLEKIGATVGQVVKPVQVKSKS